MKINLNLTLLISCSSILYFRTLPISPIYIFQILLFLALIAKGVSNEFLKKITILMVIFTIYLAIQISLNGKISVLINTFLMFFTYYMLCESITGKNEVYIEETAYKYMKFAIFIAIIETAYRISNPIYIDTPDISGLELYLYPFKRNSLMFIDSNYTSIILFSCLMLFNLNVLKFKKYKSTYSIAFILMVMTLSRATITGYFIISILQYLLSKSTRRIALYSISILIFSFITSAIVTNSSSLINIQDGSFLSKFKLLHMMYESLSSLDIQFLLFAEGLGNSDSILDGMGAHNIIVLLYTEYGFIFSFILLIFIVSNVITTRWRALPYWTSLFIIGMSLSFFLSFILTPLAFLTVDKEKE